MRQWLFICCLLVAGMVLLGGLTRLTQSGLSMVRWEPVIGAIPPLSAEAWQKEFSDYQQSPQYQKVFQDMDIEGFKQIYWLEFFHRLLGRLVGVVFALPYFYFLLRGRFSGRQAWRLAGIFMLGAAQGFMGWYMVKSGLVDDPHVSPYRLTAHLLLAVAILTLLVNELIGWVKPSWPVVPVLALTLLQLGLGGMMAGTHAGFMYNSFPLMDGHLLPPDSDIISVINFLHRWVAFGVAAGVFGLFLYYRQQPAAELMLFIVVFQIILGITTLLWAVPVPLASLHQLCAIGLWISALMLYRHAERYPNA